MEDDVQAAQGHGCVAEEVEYVLSEAWVAQIEVAMAEHDGYGFVDYVYSTIRFFFMGSDRYNDHMVD